MSGVVPYLVRAYCDWIEDSNLTPHVLVDCEKTGTVVPEGFAKKGKIVLNISSTATENRLITNDSISFKARFNGKISNGHYSLRSGSHYLCPGERRGHVMFDNKFKTKGDENDKPNLTILD